MRDHDGHPLGSLDSLVNGSINPRQAFVQDDPANTPEANMPLPNRSMAALDTTRRLYHIPIQSLSIELADLDEQPSNPELDLNTDRIKSGGVSDWDGEGLARRVGYEDLTAIDWIFEYTKERQRLKNLYSDTKGLLGWGHRMLDASQVWIILVLTGLAVGLIAASIDVASDWLGDIKTGYCSAGEDSGRFYLNKYFCCWGYSEWSQCHDWIPWSAALNVVSTGGIWAVEYVFFVILSVTFAACATILVTSFAVYARHSGIPEIKTVLGGFVIRRFMGSWTLVIKSLGLCLAVASGMWLGKEGPLVHVACCCANVFMKLFDHVNLNEARKREVLSAAAAAGISVAFGSPIGGVLFSLEQLSYYFPDKTMWQSFVCAMTAAVTLQALDPFRSGKLVLFQVTYSSGWHDFELVPFATLGILGGLYGGLFVNANMRIAAWKKRAAWLPGPVTQVVMIATLTALINYPNLYMRAQSSELVTALFSECSQIMDDQFGLCKTGAESAATIVLLIFAAVLGFFLTTITFGLQIPAGVILPSMAIGALFGRAVGIIVEVWVRNHPSFLPFRSCEPDIPCVTPGTYAIIGAAAFLGGVTRMTVSIVVITFELTGALTYVLPIMIAVMVSKWVGDSFGKRGIYESWIHFKGFPYLDNSDEVPIPDIPAGQVMTRMEDLVVLNAIGHTISSLQTILERYSYRGFPIIASPSSFLVGYISRSELSYVLHTALKAPRSLQPSTATIFTHHTTTSPADAVLDLRPWVDTTPLTLPSAASLQLTVSYFQKLGLRYVLFVDRGELQGMLTKKDVWAVLEGAEESRRAAAREVARDGGGGPGNGFVDIAGVNGRTFGGTGAYQSGLTREEGTGEARSLLRNGTGGMLEEEEDDGEEVPSPLRQAGESGGRAGEVEGTVGHEGKIRRGLDGD